MEKLLYRRFLRACESFPDNVAIIENGNLYTYSELLENVNRIACLIKQIAEDSAGNICVYMNKSVDCISAIFAIYKCNSTFVPIDKGMPNSKIEFILKDADCMMVLSDTDNTLNLPTNWINVKSGNTEILNDCSNYTDHDKSVAYILYTSGTTGEPKGIEITHRAANAFVQWSQQIFGINQYDCFSSHAPLSFDLSVFDIYCSLFSGARIALMQRGINAFVKSVKKYIIGNNISIWYSVPSIIIKLLEHDDGTTFMNLRLLIYAGEAMPYRYINKLNQLYPDLLIYNLYGPTETNVITYYKIEKDLEYKSEIPIGCPCPYAEIIIKKEDGTIAQIGESGELCVRSQTLMKGYRKKYDVTDIYHTGDIVKRIDDNCYVFLGRKDNMVKVNGFRVELEEIETALECYPGIEAAVVKILTIDDVDQIIAYYSSRGVLDEAGMKSFLSSLLQTYKIPSRYERVNTIAFNNRGKKIRSI